MARFRLDSGGGRMCISRMLGDELGPVFQPGIHIDDEICCVGVRIE
jgi:hypothetical protein